MAETEETVIENVAPEAETLTDYDRAHMATYLRLLDAEADGADWKEVAAIVLHLDPASQPESCRRTWQSHLDRAQWMAKSGYRHLLKTCPNDRN